MREQGTIVKICTDFNAQLWRTVNELWQEATDAGYGDLLVRIWGKPRNLFKALLSLSQGLEPSKDTLPLPAMLSYHITFSPTDAADPRFSEAFDRLKAFATFLQLFFFCEVCQTKNTQQGPEVIIAISLLDG